MSTPTSGIPSYFYFVTWLLVFFGWFFTNYQNHRTASRKELRDQISDIHELLSDMRETVFDFYFKEESKTEHIKHEILDSLEVIITFITVLPNQSSVPITGIEDIYYTMYAAITDPVSFDSLNEKTPTEYDVISNISFNITQLTIHL